MASANPNGKVDKDEVHSTESVAGNDSPERSNSDEEPSGAEGSSSGGIAALESLFQLLKLKTAEKKEVEKVLDEFTLDGIANYIKSGKCKNLITMAGAGISTSAGIPDFRSPGKGLYDNLQSYNLPHPQAIFEINFFKSDPRPFFTLAKELFPGSFKPTLCHYFIRLLHEKGYLMRHYTQNIDTLERVAGLPEEKIVEAHGTFYTSHCIDCNKEYDLAWMKEQIFSSESVPTCSSCSGVVKPDIVFFGENLPKRFFKLLRPDFGKCDLLVIMGSSLAVQPFASLVGRVSDSCPRLLINREKPSSSYLFGDPDMDFDSEDNRRDVAWLGDCDAGCQLLADKLGWGDELRALYKAEHSRLENGQN